MKRIIILFFCLVTLSLVTKAQDKNLIAKEVIESKNYIFKANFASPMGGRLIPLTSEYDLTVRGDTIISYLPYFGRAYSAPIDPSKGGIMFTSTNAGYTAGKTSKKWEITINPHDVSDVQKLYLTVFDNGKASLQVISTNRQNISFDGYITEGKPLNKKAF